MIKARFRWCSCRVENILTLGKLLRLWFCFLLHSILFFYISDLLSYIQNNFSYELARPIMGTIFLVWADISRYLTLRVIEKCTVSRGVCNKYVIARAGVIFGIYFTSCRYSGG